MNCTWRSRCSTTGGATLMPLAKPRSMLLCRYFAAALFVALLTTFARGQDAGGIVDPREFGLDLPAGPVARGERQAVTTTDEDGQPVVGRIHVRLGNSAVILLPDG